MKSKLYLLFFLLLVCKGVYSSEPQTPVREKFLFDHDWKFSLTTVEKERQKLGFGAATFGPFAKTGFGDGPTSKDFNDSDWVAIDLPHDWVVETGFSPSASASHGYHAGGNGVFDANLGWYRKSFQIPETDKGKKIFITFDGVFRNSMVWINGHFLGREESGYSGFTHDLSDYLNYGGKNIIAVRVDASLEEGWFYEGAGIYRHTWITKVNPIHIAEYGTYVQSVKVDEKSANLKIETTLENQTYSDSKNLKIEHSIISPAGKVIGKSSSVVKNIVSQDQSVNLQNFEVNKPDLWSVDSPALYTMKTTVYDSAKVIDEYGTKFGIRTFKIDPDKGFFLNGKHIKIQGTNNHQDHAGVGVAIPDDLFHYRVERLKDMGSNAYRASHNPTAPELLDATDELGMLVLAENRLMGTTPYHLDHMKRLILRDRNHPSVIAWSIGNEEWAMEGNELGEKITKFMQNYVKKQDDTRLVTQAISGGWGNGSSKEIEVMGFNYIGNGDTDRYHKLFPKTPSWGTEEGATFSTRGIYEEEPEKAHFVSYDKDPSKWGSSAEQSWTHYGSRDYLAGAFIWTGFDYRGEPTPYEWPAVSSQFGIMDICGFAKDNFFYYQSWWKSTPVLHVFPHWNWSGKVGKAIPVWVHSNAKEVELFQDGVSLGKKTMNKFSHLEWNVEYHPGAIEAVGYFEDGSVSRSRIETTGEAKKVVLSPNKQQVTANGESIIVVTVAVEDLQHRIVPVADNLIEFDIKGPGKILGVGNGDPSSHEPDKYISNWKRKLFSGYAQIIIQATDEPGEISLIAKSKGLESTTLVVKSKVGNKKPAI